MFLLISSAEKHRDPIQDTKSSCGFMKSSNYRPSFIMVQKKEREKKSFFPRMSMASLRLRLESLPQVIVVQRSVETQRLPLI